MVGDMKALYAFLLALVLGGCGESRIEKARKLSKALNDAKAAESKAAAEAERSAKIIEEMIRKELGNPASELNKADYEKVVNLNLSNKRLTDVTGLEKLTQIKKLWLTENQLTDIQGLEKLTQLERLYLSDNKLTDVTVLGKLTRLTFLDLGINQLKDLKGLEKLTDLKLLYLFSNPDLTKAKIDRLKKALPKCIIASNPTK